MSDTPSIGPAPKPDSTGEKITSNLPTGDVNVNVQVGTLNDLKNALVEQCGEAKGMKLYKLFVESIAKSALLEIQSSAAQAQKAAKNMMNNNG